MALKFKCEECGGKVVVKYLKPGEEAQCPHCGANVTVPETSIEVNAEPGPGKTRRYHEGRKKREWPFVPCPACGSDALKTIVFWGVPWFAHWWFQDHFKTILVRCKKCGAKFDGLTGCSIDEELSSMRNIRYLGIALFVMFSLFILALIIAK